MAPPPPSELGPTAAAAAVREPLHIQMGSNQRNVTLNWTLPPNFLCLFADTDAARMARRSGEKVGLVKLIGSTAGPENMLLKI